MLARAADVLDRAFEAGARHMTHFFNAMPALHHREPGPVGWGLARERVTCDVIADGVHVHALALQLLLRAKGTASITLISDSVAPAGLGDGSFQLWGETITVKEGRTQGNLYERLREDIDRSRQMYDKRVRPAVAGRYHLYVSLACPWSHRAVLLRKLRGLESVAAAAPEALTTISTLLASWRIRNRTQGCAVSPHGGVS